MCTYETQHLTLEGSGKGAAGWFGLTAATVYYDHPVHAFAEHTLNIDFTAPERGATARVAVELTPESAARLVAAIAAALTSAPQALTGLGAAQLSVLRAAAGATDSNGAGRHQVAPSPAETG